jgi:two-component system sensor histidine kinase PilS (NtrC family)
VLPIPHNPLLTEKDFLYNIFSHMLALYLTAYLIGYLVTRIEKRDTDIEDLTLFNREVIENTPSGLFTTDLVGKILIFNKAAEEITEIARIKAYGRNVSEIFPFTGLIDEDRLIEETVEYGGKKKVIGLTVSRMKDAKGKDIGFIGIFQDLTEIKRMAKEIQSKEKWATIGELSANIAHEIRNPLASLKGSIEMLREDAISPVHKDKLMSIALSEMDRLDHIMADFLTYSRPSTLELQNCDLCFILDKTLDLIASRTQQNITIQKNYSGPLVIEADPPKLEQVFLNLGINALDAMPHGGSLEVGVASKGGMIEITFKDTGEGIGPDDQEKVFYPFFTTKSEGTGLGLSIVHRIIEDHKGRIDLSSSPGNGTAFSILLPENNVEL